MTWLIFTLYIVVLALGGAVVAGGLGLELLRTLRELLEELQAAAT
jgi:hypothetical protein